MGILKKKILGTPNGSVGDITFSGWKGKTVIKGKAENAYSDPTVTQQKNNTAFGLLVNLARQVRSLYLVGFKALAVGMSEYNVFMSKNNPTAVTGSTPETVAIDPALLTLSQGNKAEMTSATEATLSGANTAEFEAFLSTTNRFSANPVVHVACFTSAGVFRGTTSVTATAAADAAIIPCNIVITGLVATDELIVFIEDSLTHEVNDSIVITVQS